VPRSFALAFAALLAAAPAPLQPSLDRAVDLVFQPFSAPPAARAPAAWQRPIWSRETAALIAQWRKATPKDKTDALSDGDWLCQCRAWDQHAFRLTILSQKIDPAGHAIVNVGYRLNSLDNCTARLLLSYERGAWKLDDLFDDDFPQGLQAALRLTTAQDLRR
jgi:hypothetical protein